MCDIVKKLPKHLQRWILPKIFELIRLYQTTPKCENCKAYSVYDLKLCWICYGNNHTALKRALPVGAGYAPQTGPKKKHLKIAKAVAKAKTKKEGLYNQKNLQKYIKEHNGSS